MTIFNQIAADLTLFTFFKAGPKEKKIANSVLKLLEPHIDQGEVEWLVGVVECSQCKKSFMRSIKSKRDVKYCGSTCRQRAHRERKRKQ